MDPYDYPVDLEVDATDAVLTVGETHAVAYGNGYDGLTDEDGILTFEFENGGRGVIIEFDTFDIDWNGEVYVYMNGEVVGAALNGWADDPGKGRVAVDASYVNDGNNVLQFVAVEGSDLTWGVSNILVFPEPSLVFGQFLGQEFGHRFGNSIETDGKVSFQFFYQSAEDLTLYVQGYDIDFYGEVEVFLNGASMGFMEAGPDNGLVGSAFDIATEDILSGGNLITFEATRSLEWAWGVTDLILLNAGANVSTMAIDPEFTDDGWVTWQEADRIYIGKYDTNSGALLEVLNESVAGALPFAQTFYGSEFVLTANGPVALGISEAGIIYLDENDSYILEGTEGLRVGFLPKGDYDGLRFTMVDLDFFVYDGGEVDVYLYDNGNISILDFEGDKTTRAVTWLNESEVVTFSSTQMGIYNVDTGVLNWFSPDVYDEGYIAALETSSGEKYISVLHDDGFTDLWMETANGWEVVRRLVIPDEVFGSYLFSPEFIETSDGKLYLMGISAELATTTDLTAIVIYDIEADTWSQMTEPQFAFDPEIVELDNGNFALYYRNTVTPSTDWIVVTGEEVLEAAVPGVVTPLPGARAADDQSRIAPNSAFMAAEAVSITTVGLAPVTARATASSTGRIAEDLIEVSEADSAILTLLGWASSDVFEFEPLRESDRAGGVGSAVLAADLSALISGIGRGL